MRQGLRLLKSESIDFIEKSLQRSPTRRQPQMAGPRCGQVDQVRRAVELAHLDKVSKSFGALTSGGVLPLEEAAVREAFRTFLQPNNESPIAGCGAIS